LFSFHSLMAWPFVSIDIAFYPGWPTLVADNIFKESKFFFVVNG
jgi:hypothetical protein